MSKSELLVAILGRLRAELDLLTRAALATHAEATHEENRAEDKYDTRGLEASYLAHGQSRAAEEAADAVAQFQALPARDFGPGEAIALGALVRLEDGARYFVGPRAGGTEVQLDGATVLVVTPSSPLGRQLVGRRAGDVLPLALGPRRSTVRIVDVR
jgi:transcription elongation GreA/GreB family factor